MIAIDTSALMAIVLKEDEAVSFAAVLQAHDRVLIGTPTLLEFRMVGTTRFSPVAEPDLMALVFDAPFEHIAFSHLHYEAALAAFRRFGKGRHPASLNFGDCMAYAVASVANCPLLFKGNDFRQTDITLAA